MKAVYHERQDQPLFIKNLSGESEIVLVFPITRDAEENLERWDAVIELVERSDIATLLVIDKTQLKSATLYFVEKFECDDKRLIVLPRSIEDTLFDSVGEIVLDQDMWIIQVHDDDLWSGSITLPKVVDSETVYSFNFFLLSVNKELVQIKNYSLPNRIVFSLVPSGIWNRFSKLVRDENYHVAGSFDFVLNRMAQLTCKFELQTGFEYQWKDDNWGTRRTAIAHLTRLAERDGWGEWSSPEIANLNRLFDSLASLNYLKDLLDPKTIDDEICELLNGIRPSKKRKLKHGLLNPIFTAEIILRRFLLTKEKTINQSPLRRQRQLILHKLIEKTWQVTSIDDLFDLIAYIELLGNFEKLESRFKLWKSSLSDLNERL